MLEFQHIPIKFKGLDQKTDDKNVTEGDFLELQNVEMQKTFQLRNRSGFSKKNASLLSGYTGIARFGNTYALLGNNGAIYTPEVGTGINSRKYNYEFSDPLELSTSEYNQGYSISVGTNSVANTNRGISLVASNRDGANISYSTSVFDMSTKVVNAVYTDKIPIVVTPGICSIATSHATSGYTASINFVDTTFWRIQIFDATGARIKNITQSMGTSAELFDIILIYTGTDHILVIAQKSSAVSGPVYLSTYTLSTNTFSGLTAFGNNITTKFSLNKGTTPGRACICWYDTVTFNTNANTISVPSLAVIASESLNNSFTTAVCSAVSCVDRGGSNLGLTFTGYIARVGPVEPFFYTQTKNITLVGTTSLLANFFPAARPVYFENDVVMQWIHVPLNVDTAGAAKGMDEYATGFITKGSLIIATFGFGKYILSQSYFGRSYTLVFPCEFGISSTKINIPVGFRRKYVFGVGEIESQFKVLTGTATTSASLFSLRDAAMFNVNGNVVPFVQPGIPTTGYPPNFVSNLVIKTSTTGGNIAAGDYNYIAVKVVTMGTKMFRGTPTAPVKAVTTGATSSNIITMTNFGTLSDMTDYENKDEFVEIYRTEATGTVYYLVGVATSTFTDTLSDASLAGRPILLSPSGVLDASTPPLCRGITLVKNRIFAASAEEASTVIFSTVGTNDEEPRFNEVLKFSIRSSFSQIVGFAELDDKVVIFCNDSIYVTFGDGPDEAGLNGYPEPQLICAGIGCKYQRSIVQTPDGVMFMSYDGIKLLNKGMTVEDIGSHVEDFNDYTVSAALNLTDRDQVWFYTVEGTTLVWDKYHKIWYTFTGMPSYAAFIDNNNVPCFLRSSTNYLLKEDSTVFNDDSVPFDCVLGSGNITLSGIQGFQRMRRLSWISSLTDNASVELWSNFSATKDETITVNAGTVGTPHQFEVKPKVQKVEAKRWRITVDNITGPCTFSGFSIEAGLKKGSYKKPTTKRVGG